MCDCLIPFPELHRPGCLCIPVVSFVGRTRAWAALLGLVALLAEPLQPAWADAGTERAAPEPIYRPIRPQNTGEFLVRCKEDSLYCEEQFSSYVQRYLAVRVEEFAKQEEYRKMRENLRDPQAFDGICLPREKVLGNDFPVEISRKFRAWAEKHKEAHAQRVPVGVKAAMQAIYPCS